MKSSFGIISMWLLAATFMWSCKQSGGGTSNSDQGATKFTPPEIPAMLVDMTQRADYAALHWWDCFDLADTAAVTRDSVVMEKAFPDWLEVMHYTSPEGANTAIDKIITRTGGAGDMFYYFTDMAEKYLWDPNSPMRNEPLYEKVLLRVEASADVADVDKIRPRSQLARIALNRIGSTASDFVYETASGQRSRMSAIRAQYLLLYFFNPECHDCQRVREQMVASPIISAMLAEGKLKILALYPDADIEAWKKHQAEIPAKWINGRDPEQVISKNVYDLRAIPNLYLLDANKTIILKDAPIERVEAELQKVH